MGLPLGTEIYGRILCVWRARYIKQGRGEHVNGTGFGP
jgi:hypothetical protein